MSDRDPQELDLAVPSAEDMSSLAASLYLARVMFENDGGVNLQRAGACLALMSVRSLLQSMNFPGSFQRPLIAVLAALQDVERGKVSELLKPRKLDHRPKDATSAQLTALICAVAMNLFLHGGLPKDDAARRVAAAFRGKGYRDITPTKIANWREKVSSEAAYKRLSSDTLAQNGGDILKAADRFLESSIEHLLWR